MVAALLSLPADDLIIGAFPQTDSEGNCPLALSFSPLFPSSAFHLVSLSPLALKSKNGLPMPLAAPHTGMSDLQLPLLQQQPLYLGMSICRNSIPIRGSTARP